MLRILRDEPDSWQGKLEEEFRVRRYVFDTRLHGVKSFSDLNFDGRASSMMSAIRTLAGRFEGQPLAGVILLSDGNATDHKGYFDDSNDFDDLDLSGLPPIYPVVLGSDEPVKDVSIKGVAVSETAFEDAPVNVKAEVEVSGFKGEKISAKLIPIWQNAFSSNSESSRSNSTSSNSTSSNSFSNSESSESSFSNSSSKSEFEFGTEEQIQESSNEKSALNFRFQFRPKRSGISFYQLQVAVNESESGDVNEATMANNRRVLVIDRGGGPHRILYVAGRPNWEYKFLHRALYEDDQVQLVGLIRVARRSPRFEFKGRRGETSNPLFRGFDKQDDLTEQYDQPVLTRLNIRDEGELVGGFPKVPELLYEYAAVILDDLESGFFTRDQLSLLQKYVSERGGGFLALGGSDSLIDGNYSQTPVEAMLPVYLDRSEDSSSGEVRLEMTREGMLETWLRLRSTEDQERERLDEMPSFKVLSKVGKAKPGAMILMEAIEETGERHPALVVQRYGKGKTASLLIGDLWRWQMRDKTQSGDQAKAWRQLIRWLISDVPKRIEMSIDRAIDDANQAVRIGVRVKDERFWPAENARVDLMIKSFSSNPSNEIHDDHNDHYDDSDSDDSEIHNDQKVDLNFQQSGISDTKIVRLIAEASPSEIGLYEALYIPREVGGYAIEATISDSNGLTLGRAEAGWSADPASEEFASLNPNRALMKEIAQMSKGEIIEKDALQSFVKTLPSRNVPLTESFTSPLWHTGWCFALALGCFIAEWGIRRRRGLA